MTQPTTGYTPDEIQTAVEQLVSSSINTPYDALGVRRTDLTFGQIQQAAAGVFILYPNAPYYTLSLAVQRLKDLVTAEAAIVAQLTSAISATGRRVLPVADVSTLFNAQAALQSLATAAVQRTSSLNVQQAPAYQQFSSNVQQFLSGPGQNVVDSGQIVQTPQEAMGSIPALMTQLAVAHLKLVAAVQLIVDGQDNYNALNLPSIVAASVLQSAATLVGSSAQTMSPLTPDQRLAQVRTVVLNLLASRTAVNTFGVFSGPSDFYSLDGLGMPYSDAQHLATPATATATRFGGVAVVAGVSDVLSLAIDGAAPFNVTLAPSLLAELDGQLDDSNFVIGNGTAPASPGLSIPNNDILKMRLGGAPVQVTLPVSGLATHATETGTGLTNTAGWYGGGGLLDGKTLTLVSDGGTIFNVTLVAPANVGALLTQVNAVTNAGGQHDVAATNVAHHLVLTSSVTVGSGATITSSGTAASILGLPTGQVQGSGGAQSADALAASITARLPAGFAMQARYAPLKYSGRINIPGGVNTSWVVPPGTGDLTQLSIGVGDSVQVESGANIGIYSVLAVTPTTIQVQGTVVSDAAALIQIGPLNRRLKLVCTNAAVQVPLETSIQIYGDDAVSTACLTTLGFSNGSVSSGKLTTPDVVAADIASKTRSVTPGTTTVPLIASTPARGDLVTPSQVTLAAGAATGSSSVAGDVLTFTVTDLSATLIGLVFQGGTLSTGDTIAMRSGPSPNFFGPITTINGAAASGHELVVGDVVRATGFTGASSSASISVEFGPTVSITKYDVVTVAQGANTGGYFVSGRGVTGLDVLLQKTLPAPIQSGQVAAMTVSYGRMALTLSSSNQTTASKVVVNGTAATLFFVTVPFTQLGTTPWFQLPSLPLNLQSGDILETYATNYALPDNTYFIDLVVPGLNILQLTPDIPDGVSWQFTPQPVPFARLRVGTVNDYTQVQTAMQAWLDSPVNQPLFFTNFNRLVNPLLAGAPTAVQVAEATQALKQLSNLLQGVAATTNGADPTLAIDSISATYTVEKVPQVDTLIASFLQNGGDRAVDILVSGDFQNFFGLSQQDSSYAGAFQSAATSVAQNDLPVTKFNRIDATTSQLVGQSASPDLEYPANLALEQVGGAEVSPPVTPGTPSNYGTTVGSQGAGG